METQTISVDWQVLISYLLSAAAPTIMGFLQQFSKEFAEKAPWWAKSIVTAGLGALITAVTSYLTAADASIAAGAIVATIGSVNIALRKGTRTNLLQLRQERVEEAVKKACGEKTPNEG